MNTVDRALAPSPTTGEHLCKPWVGRLLASPLRTLLDSPRRLLEPFVEPGMTVLDVGSGMGAHSIPAARMVGPDGRVLALEVQAPMLRGLIRRACRRDLMPPIEARLCRPHDLRIAGEAGQVDLALLIHTVHEMTEPEPLLQQIRDALRPGGRLLVQEPAGHIDDADRDAIFALIEHVGFEEERRLDGRRARGAIYVRP